MRRILTGAAILCLALDILLACASMTTTPPQAMCNIAAADPIVHVAVASSPFQALPTADGCWAFVSVSVAQGDGPHPGVVLLKRAGGTVSVARELRVPDFVNATGMALTHDGKLLAVAMGTGVGFIDVDRFIAGVPDALRGIWRDDLEAPGRVYLNASPDDRYLFVSDESAQSITVLDLSAARKSGFDSANAIGRIPVGRSPVALTFSKDGKYLYTTSQSMPNAGWPLECAPEGATDPAAAPNHAQGAVLVVDVARATTDPAKAVVATIKAGCNPVRLVLNPRGDRAYVSARKDNALLVFDTRKFLTDPAHARLATVPVGTAPVGVAVIDDGKRVLVTNSNRFNSSADDRQSVTVVDAARVAAGAGAVLGSFPAGAFPREMRVTADGRTLFLTNFNSKTVDVIDLARLPITKTVR